MQIIVIDAGLSDRESRALFELVIRSLDLLRAGSQKTGKQMADMWEIEPEGYEVIRDTLPSILIQKPDSPAEAFELAFSSPEERALYDAAVALKRSRQTTD